MRQKKAESDLRKVLRIIRNNGYDNLIDLDDHIEAHEHQFGAMSVDTWMHVLERHGVVINAYLKAIHVKKVESREL